MDGDLRNLSLRGLRKSYGSGRRSTEVLRGIDLEIPYGEFSVLMGRNGCGKTTLLRVLMGLESLDGGEIIRPSENSNVGMMFQEPRLLPWLSVRENMAMPFVGDRTEEDSKLLEDLIVRLGLKEHENAFPRELSGGLAQRTALGRLLCCRPEIMLLDEPFAAMDGISRLDVRSDLLSVTIGSGKTVVMVTHDVEEALALGQRIVVMDHGRIGKRFSLSMGYPRDPGYGDVCAAREEIIKALSDASSRKEK